MGDYSRIGGNGHFITSTVLHLQLGKTLHVTVTGSDLQPEPWMLTGQ